MNREIKFRVWDCERRYFLKSLNYGIRLDSLSISSKFLESDSHGNYKISKKSLIIQEYAGLKTKTGEEIYEGDIIITKAARYEVVFRDGMFVAKWLMGVLGDWPLKDVAETAFIIGNIFENPELIKDVIKEHIKKHE